VPPVGIACCNGSSPAYFGMRSSVETGKQAGSLSMGKDVVRREKKKKAGLLADQHHHPVQSEAEEEAAQQPAETFSNRQS